MNTVLAFSGKIASGKSTLSAAVAKELGWLRVSFGEHVRRVAVRRGANTNTPHALQELGEALVQQNVDAFCRDTLHEGGWRAGQPVVIDGLRHACVAEKLRTIVSPTPLYLI